jgi:hypothetical protein
MLSVANRRPTPINSESMPGRKLHRLDPDGDRLLAGDNGDGEIETSAGERSPPRPARRCSGSLPRILQRISVDTHIRGFVASISRQLRG